MDKYCGFRVRSIASLLVQTGQATCNKPIQDFIIEKALDLRPKRSLRIHSNCGNELSVLKGQGRHLFYIAIL